MLDSKISNVSDKCLNLYLSSRESLPELIYICISLSRPTRADPSKSVTYILSAIVVLQPLIALVGKTVELGKLASLACVALQNVARRASDRTIMTNRSRAAFRYFGACHLVERAPWRQPDSCGMLLGRDFPSLCNRCTAS